MKEIASVDPHVGFVEALDIASSESEAVRYWEGFLRSTARLRNAIVHVPTQNGRVIADPRPEAVEDLENALESITKPPLILPEYKVTVEMCSTDDRLLEAVGGMERGRFSQLPAYEGRRFEELLTAETVVRWLAVKGRSVALEGVLVSEPLWCVAKG